MATLRSDEISALVNTLDDNAIASLVDWLSEKDDVIRYNAFTLLLERSKIQSDVYPYWDIFKAKMKSENSYQRTIGIQLLVENVRWDTQRNMDSVLPESVALLHVEKPITIRQYIKALHVLVCINSEYDDLIASKLMEFDLSSVRETMRKSIALDMIGVLAAIHKKEPNPDMFNYIGILVSSGDFDAKGKKTIQAMLA